MKKRRENVGKERSKEINYENKAQDFDSPKGNKEPVTQSIYHDFQCLSFMQCTKRRFSKMVYPNHCIAQQVANVSTITFDETRCLEPDS